MLGALPTSGCGLQEQIHGNLTETGSLNCLSSKKQPHCPLENRCGSHVSGSHNPNRGEKSKYCIMRNTALASSDPSPVLSKALHIPHTWERHSNCACIRGQPCLAAGSPRRRHWRYSNGFDSNVPDLVRTFSTFLSQGNHGTDDSLHGRPPKRGFQDLSHGPVR